LSNTARQNRYSLGIIGAHAMDAELMGGAIAYKLSNQNWDSYFIHVTRGERGHPKKSKEEFAQQLQIEMEECALKLNSTSIWCGFAAGDVPINPCVQKLEELITSLHLDVIITHWRGSFHVRHRLTHDCVIKAIENITKTNYKTPRLYFGENMEDLDSFIPNVYFDISSCFDIWFGALCSYELFRESSNHFPYQEFYKSNSIVRGLETGYKFAKGLMGYRRVTCNLLTCEPEKF
jgi:Uncharacterized proteins, LmbE homologs